MFHLIHCIKSKKSCKVSSRCVCVRKKTTFVGINCAVCLRVGGHIVKWCRMSHSLGIRPGIVSSIHTSCCLVYVHINSPSLHWLSLCWTVSLLSQCWHLSVGAIRILCRLSFVGRMSFTTLYHAAFVAPGTGVSARFSHTVGQTVSGHNVVILISRIK